MAVKFFVLGLPGSGKSTVAQYIYTLARDRRCSAAHINDYAILRRMFETDKHRQFAPTKEYDGFDILDLTVFNTALQKLEEVVNKHIAASDKLDEMILIEFARNDYDEAFRQFSPAFLQNSYFIYLHTTLETCKQRIRDRVANPQTKDDYFVSDYIFDVYYSKENGLKIPDILEKDFAISRQNVLMMENNCFLEDSSKEIELFVTRLFHGASSSEEATESTATEAMRSLAVVF